MSLKISSNGESKYPEKNLSDAHNTTSNRIKIFAEFNNNDNVVDLGDVIYTNGTKPSDSIQSFLKEHQNETWSAELLKKIQSLIDDFNNKHQKEQSPPSGLLSKYEAFKNSVTVEIQDFKGNAFKEFIGFREEANEKIIQFNDDIKKESNDFKRECITKVLNDLKKDGWNGQITFVELGTLIYDKEQQKFVFIYDSNPENPKTLSGNKDRNLTPEQQLEILINTLLEKGYYIIGKSEYKSK